MNITVFGGTGVAGLLLIQKVLERGHKVTAFVRTPSTILIQHRNLQIVEGQLTDADKIEDSIKGADAVISLLGPTGKSKELVISNGTKNIIGAMEKNGTKRLIATVSSSYRDSNDKFQFWFDFGVVMLKVLASNILKDIVLTGHEISESKLDWTIVRLPKLSSSQQKEELNIGYTGNGRVKFFSLTRGDLADFLIQQLNDNSYIHKAPVVSN